MRALAQKDQSKCDEDAHSAYVPQSRDLGHGQGRKRIGGEALCESVCIRQPELAISVSEARARAANRKTQQAFLARKRAELAALATGEPTHAAHPQLRKVVAVNYVDKGTERNRSKAFLGPPGETATST